MREIRPLRAMLRTLETGLRNRLTGHEGGNAGHRQDGSYGLPRQRPTLPGIETVRVSWNSVGPDFFKTLKIPLLGGRDFNLTGYGRSSVRESSF